MELWKFYGSIYKEIYIFTVCLSRILSLLFLRKKPNKNKGVADNGGKIQKSRRLVKTGVNLTSFGPIPIIRKNSLLGRIWNGIRGGTGKESLRPHGQRAELSGVFDHDPRGGPELR
jgi:hypothetical protein